MKRNDWIGITTSLLLHAGLLFGLSFMSLAAADPIPLGYVEVDFGPFAEGRPVARAPQNEIEATAQAEEAQEEEPAPSPPPTEARPVALPQQTVADPETVTESAAETVAPQSNPQAESTENVDRPEDSRPVRPLGSGDPQGDERQQDGQDGTGSEVTRTAPYQIEGLNRIPVATVTPNYSEQVNADIRVRITVDPSGRIVGRLPLMKGDPRLEEAVMLALANWRFNPLPPAVPQINQTGVVTFRFRLQ